MKRAVFLDRDGTINIEKKYLSKPEQLVLFPGAEAAMKRLQDAGYLLLIVTNQSGIGRGYYTEADMHKVHERLLEMFQPYGLKIAKIYYAPESPEDPSRGRKPSPAFLHDARDEFGIDLAQSYMIGDKLIDLQCGWNAGVKKSILVRTGYGAEWERDEPELVKQAWVVDSLEEAAEKILKA
ncbi:MAG: D,D-heptose 1,7-bisphosphate phosphatase [Verrucomicrobia bacterium]|nr:D,D-heptose 1,7-bisphosphate phosphatase [Verrucomicrobiota bacterium]